MSTKIAENGVKVDFHIHSYNSITKDKETLLKNSSLENIPLLIEKLNDNEIQMCAFTDHDVFNFEYYKELKKYEKDENSSLIKVLPGIEFSVFFERMDYKKQLHVIALFPDDDELKLKKMEEIMKSDNNKPKYDCEESFSENKFIQLLSDIGLDTVLIAHQKQTLSSKSKPRDNDANSLGEEAFNEFVTSEYFEAFEFKNKKNELFNNLSSSYYDNDLLRFITGSDCHDWVFYPKHDQRSNDNNFKFTYFKCLPTFKGIAFALTDQSRISLENNFFTTDSNNYIDSIDMKINDVDNSIPLSKGINVIIGDNSIGKSLVLHKLTNYYRKNENSETSAINAIISKGYENYLNKNNIEITTTITPNKIFEFDTQGEIRKKFDLQKFDSKGFYKKKFPPDVEVGEIKRMCLEYVNQMINYLESKFEFDKQLEKIHDLNLLKSEINAFTVTYIDCENYHDKKIKELNGIRNQIIKVIYEIDKLINLNIEQNEKKEITIMKKYLEDLNVKYLNMITILNKKIRIINTINTEFAKITKKKEEINTAEEEVLSRYINKRKSFEKTIQETYCKRDIRFLKFDNINQIKVVPNVYPYLEYNFVKRTDISLVDENYIRNLLAVPLKKGVSIDDLASISKIDFINSLKNYNDEKYQPIEYYKMKIMNKLQNDLKSKLAIVKNVDNEEMSYSSGVNSQIYFDITCSDKFSNGIYIIDQPEDDISPYAIKKYLLDDFKRMSKNRQIILVTHNPQFVVNLDVDNVIVMKKSDKQDSLIIESGALEYEHGKTNIIKSIADTLDGGIESIKKRWKRYEKDNTN